jgi:glutaredoxin
MISLTLYARPDCCLCEEMKRTVLAVQAEISFTLDTVNISGDPDLETRFGYDIPVLFINGHKAFKYRVTAGELRRRLQREQAALTKERVPRD